MATEGGMGFYGDSLAAAVVDFELGICDGGGAFFAEEVVGTG